ncbi:MAG: FtsH protease activity modulator HflK [Candidatus Schmidhempelia sp.]|nr:FtsH protease activity modulator HflK [Candidatus Schmidhempelia sp.]
MAWNQPGNNGQNNDPWGSNKRKPEQSTANYLDRFKKILGGNNNQSGGVQPLNLSIIAIAILALIIVIWFFNGFYTINQSQRGVVTRFGQVQQNIIEPGLNWNPPLIDKVYPVDIKGTRSFNVQGFMVTAGENLVFVEMNVQYRVTNPIKYLFNVTNVEDSLRQAADSALRTEIGSSQMDDILTSGRADLENRTKEGLIRIITHYDMGITIVDLNFQSARPPEEVQEAFNDAIKAREDREREINKANADKVQLEQQAEGRAARILAEANAYKIKVELEAQGDVARFEKLLPEYRQAPEITRERLYLETMEKVLSATNKVLLSEQSGNLMVLPLDQLLKSKTTNQTVPEGLNKTAPSLDLVPNNTIIGGTVPSSQVKAPLQPVKTNTTRTTTSMRTSSGR